MILSFIVFIFEKNTKKGKETVTKENDDEEHIERQNDETETPIKESSDAKIGKTKVDVNVLADIEASFTMPASNVEEVALP